MLLAGLGDLSINGVLATPGELFLEGRLLSTGAGASAKANALYMSAKAGIGSSTTPFATEASTLLALNTHERGSSPINIANRGTLSLGSVHQKGSGNEGNVSITNVGDVTVRDFDPKQGKPRRSRLRVRARFPSPATET